MRRPLVAPQARGPLPLVAAAGASAAGIERIPGRATRFEWRLRTGPAQVHPRARAIGLPHAFRAADSWSRSVTSRIDSVCRDDGRRARFLQLPRDRRIRRATHTLIPSGAVEGLSPGQRAMSTWMPN